MSRDAIFLAVLAYLAGPFLALLFVALSAWWPL
ncbi:hypothetical protein CURE108131_20860 [Cupriavidus respiraculi]|uniref:Uncharacterized protein n=1 Tax=Cupriavidus respiraculi TaxID=195930 RepID=A0ABN7YIK6_9BURK|nr:hypothetical protein LMG21510_02182 [Cupriavidus respiraculi]